MWYEKREFESVSLTRKFIRRNWMTEDWRSVLLQRGLYDSNMSEDYCERIRHVNSMQSVNEPRKLRDILIIFSWLNTALGPKTRYLHAGRTNKIGSCIYYAKAKTASIRIDYLLFTR
jgi:hypothetical protein